MTIGKQSASGYAIAIGINQYQNFQPLNYALRDAQAVQAFLTAGQLSPDCALLLTDTSPMVEQGNTYPNRANIEAALTYIARKPKANDFLWVFFSGYGVQVDGQDYLMSIDAAPTRASETGIAISQLFATLQSATTRNILVLLDINRSQSAIAQARVGEQTAAIAAQTGIPTILSCQPDQFAHETLALRHGLFTAALLEGLRYGNCTTIDHLVQFLHTRLPELSEHHWRPRQEPLAIVPAEARYQLLLPRPSLLAPLDETPDNGKQPVPVAAAIGNGHSATVPTAQPTQPIAIAAGLPDLPIAPANPSTAVVPVPSPALPVLEDEEDPRFWRSLLALGGLLFALLFLGVLFQNRDELTEAPTPIAPTATATPPTIDPTATAVSPTPTAPAPTTPSPTATDSAVVSPSPTAPPPTPAPTATTPAVSIAPATTQSAALNAVRASLDRAIAASPNTQISAFSRAVQQAGRIPKTDPAYAQAQQDIDRWSQLILNVAEQRANQSNGGSRRRAVQNYRSAIAAARLVPRDRPVLYARAQRLIAAWNRRIQ